jgi:hypothetical protein
LLPLILHIWWSLNCTAHQQHGTFCQIRHLPWWMMHFARISHIKCPVLGHVIMSKVIKKIMYILIMKVCELGKLEWDIANKAKSRFQAHMATNRETCSFFCRHLIIEILIRDGHHAVLKDTCGEG